MAHVTINNESLVFETVEGQRTTVALATLMGLDADGDQVNEPDVHGLILWTSCFQAVELNQRLHKVFGSFAPANPQADPPTPPNGTGIFGFLGQLVMSTLEVSEKTGRSVQLMEDIQSRSAAAVSMDPAAFAAQAMAAARGMMTTPPTADVENQGDQAKGKGNGAAS